MPDRTATQPAPPARPHALPDPLPLTPHRQRPDTPHGPTSGDADRIVASEELLRGARTVAIRHNGAVYRLQATRLGKLILTK